MKNHTIESECEKHQPQRKPWFDYPLRNMTCPFFCRNIAVVSVSGWCRFHVCVVVEIVRWPRGHGLFGLARSLLFIEWISLYLRWNCMPGLRTFLLSWTLSDFRMTVLSRFRMPTSRFFYYFSDLIFCFLTYLDSISSFSFLWRIALSIYFAMSLLVFWGATFSVYISII